MPRQDSGGQAWSRSKNAESLKIETRVWDLGFNVEVRSENKMQNVFEY